MRVAEAIRCSHSTSSWSGTVDRLRVRPLEARDEVRQALEYEIGLVLRAGGIDGACGAGEHEDCVEAGALGAGDVGGEVVADDRDPLAVTQRVATRSRT